MKRRSLLLAAFAAATLLASPAIGAEAFSWDGTWSGRSAAGRSTTIKIAKGKVTAWISNGETQKIASSSVGKSGVSIQHVGGATVRMTAEDDGTARYLWKGRGASSTAILKR